MSCAVWCAARGATAERLTDVRHTRMVWSARAGGCRALRHCVAQRKCPGEASVTTAIAKPLAPVVIFAHRRPEHLRRTLASLMRCPGFEESPIIVYGDGPRRNDEREHVATTRRVAREMLGSRAEYHFRDANLGLDPSVICGVTEVVERFGRVIVIEDDLELAPGFLTYMNAALDRYAGESSVYQVSGYQIDVPEFAQRDGAMFLPFIVPWGWATWRRAWDQFDPLASGWTRLLTDKTMRRRFNVGGGGYDYTTMLVRAMSGLDGGAPWDIRWCWTVFKADGLVLFPPVSLVRNIGLDGSGTHGRGWLRRFPKENIALPSFGIDLPESICLDAGLYAQVKKALQWQNGRWIARAVDKLRWWMAICITMWRTK